MPTCDDMMALDAISRSIWAQLFDPAPRNVVTIHTTRYQSLKACDFCESQLILSWDLWNDQRNVNLCRWLRLSLGVTVWCRHETLRAVAGPGREQRFGRIFFRILFWNVPWWVRCFMMFHDVSFQGYTFEFERHENRSDSPARTGSMAGKYRAPCRYVGRIFQWCAAKVPGQGQQLSWNIHIIDVCTIYI